MADSTDIQRKLQDITMRQCQILYWVCQGQSYPSIAKKLSWSVNLVQAEMSEIYDLFGLRDLSRDDKRRVLFETICPIHLNQVSNLEVDCSKRTIEIGEPKPDPQTLAIVKKDERDGIIPIGGPLTTPARESQMLDQYRGNLPQLPPKQSRLPWIVIGFLSAVVLALTAALVYFASGGKLFSETRVIVAPTVVFLTQPPVVVTQTLLITQVPANPVPPNLTPQPTSVPATQPSATLRPTGVSQSPTDIPPDFPGRILFASPNDPKLRNPILGWQPRNSTANSYDLTVYPGALTISAGAGTELWQNTNTGPMVTYPITGNFETQVKLIFTPFGRYQDATLGVRSAKSFNTWLRIGKYWGDQGPQLASFADRNGGGLYINPSNWTRYEDNIVYLKIERRGQLFTNSFRLLLGEQILRFVRR